MLFGCQVCLSASGQTYAKTAHMRHVCQQDECLELTHVSGQTDLHAFNAGLFSQKPARIGCTPNYAPPEMLAYMGSVNAHISATAGDVWALGCIAIFLFTGRSPFVPKDIQHALMCCHDLHQQWVSIKIDSETFAGSLMSINKQHTC